MLLPSETIRDYCNTESKCGYYQDHFIFYTGFEIVNLLSSKHKFGFIVSVKHRANILKIY